MEPKEKEVELETPKKQIIEPNQAHSLSTDASSANNLQEISTKLVHLLSNKITTSKKRPFFSMSLINPPQLSSGVPLIEMLSKLRQNHQKIQQRRKEREKEEKRIKMEMAETQRVRAIIRKRIQALQLQEISLKQQKIKQDQQFQIIKGVKDEIQECKIQIKEQENVLVPRQQKIQAMTLQLDENDRKRNELQEQIKQLKEFIQCLLQKKDQLTSKFPSTSKMLQTYAESRFELAVVRQQLRMLENKDSIKEDSNSQLTIKIDKNGKECKFWILLSQSI